MNNRSLKRKGLTILELMTSAVIAAIMLSGVLGISVSMFKQKYEMSDLSDQLTNTNALYRQIEFDLSNSRFITFTGTKCELIGYASKSSSGMPLQKSTKVVYELKQIGAEQFLVRNQIVDGKSKVRNDLVGHQIERFDLFEFDAKTNKWNSLVWNGHHRKRISIPDALRIQVFKQRNKLPFFDEVFCFNVSGGTK